MPPSSIIGAIIICGIVVTGLIHYKLSGILTDVGIDIDTSRVIFVEVVPGFVFSTTLFLYLLPSIYYAWHGSPPTWAPTGLIWRFATVIGTLAITLSSVSWVLLISKIHSIMSD